jgi:hypothetical protein
MHTGRQRNFAQTGRRHIAKLAQKNQMDHPTSAACVMINHNRPLDLAKKAQAAIILAACP